MNKVTVIALCAFKFASSDAMIGGEYQIDNGLASSEMVYPIVQAKKLIADGAASAVASARVRARFARRVVVDSERVLANTLGNNATYSEDFIAHVVAPSVNIAGRIFPAPPPAIMLLVDDDDDFDIAVVMKLARNVVDARAALATAEIVVANAEEALKNANDKMRFLFGTCVEINRIKNKDCFLDNRSQIAIKRTQIASDL